eukprot:gene16824-23030_t
MRSNFLALSITHSKKIPRKGTFVRSLTFDKVVGSKEMDIVTVQFATSANNLSHSYKGLLEITTDYSLTSPIQSLFSPNSTQRLHLNLELLKSSSSKSDAYNKIKYAKLIENIASELPKPSLIVCDNEYISSAVTAILKKDSFDEIVAKSSEIKVLSSWVETVVNEEKSQNPLFFRQLFEKESSTYSYILADHLTRDAILIDPVLETVERDYQIIKELNLNLKYVINTHIHADHITGSGKLKQKIIGLQSILSYNADSAPFVSDVKVSEYDSIPFGTRKLFVLPTPGHTQ